VTPRTQDRHLTQISLRKGNIFFCHVVLIGFCTDNPQNFSVSVDVNTAVPRPLAVGLLFGAPLASVLGIKPSQPSRLCVHVTDCSK
jgi:hypothetical protein